MIEYWWLIPVGFGAGIFGSLVGMGGGMLMVFVLILTGTPHTAAVSQSLLATPAGTASTVLSYSRKTRIDYKMAAKMGIAASPGTLVGALLLTQVPPDIFRIILVAFLVASAIYILIKSRTEHGDERAVSRMGWQVIVLCFCAGVVTSLLGTGSGVILVPVCIIILGLTMRHAAPTALLALVMISSMGALFHLALGHPELLHAMFLAAGLILGGIVAPRIHLRMREQMLRQIASTTILGAAAVLIYDEMVGLDLMWHDA